MGWKSREQKIAEATNASNERIARETNAANTAINEANIAYAREAWQKEVDYNWQMFQAENEYNSASAQRQRLEDAGLNPYLMMNGGDAGTASGSSSPSHNQPSQIPMQGYRVEGWDPNGRVQRILGSFDALNDMLTSYYGNRKVAAEADMAWQDSQFRRVAQTIELAKAISGIHNVNADTKNKLLENYIGESTAASRIESSKLGVDMQKNQIKQIQVNIKAAEAGLPYIGSESLARIDNLVQDAIYKKLQNKRYDEITSAQLSEIYADVAFKNKSTLNMPTLTFAQSKRLGEIMVESQESQLEQQQKNILVTDEQVRDAQSGANMPTWIRNAGTVFRTLSPFGSLFK